jgi:hypothetical protein
MRAIAVRAFSRASSILISAVLPIFTHFCLP